ncbi:MAG: pseudouridine-5'-phosphate glycosidase [Candidatus Rifleibacteriota bacterium]
MFNQNLKINPKVQMAIENKKPVVALESTIISHGMPYPQNVETARLLEQTIEENGAIPATIAILDGKMCIGLDSDQIEKLGTERNVYKASRRDLPTYVARGFSAATTVSATMICAHLAGIKFFATGGIGGVHRKASQTFDISADLEEFCRTPVLVVCAGAKAVLDIPATMEYLETRGVPVLGYRTDEIPAFYYADSGIRVPTRFEEPKEAAYIFKKSGELGYHGGMLVGNPISKEFALPKAEIEQAIEEALRLADEQNISGQGVTPFLLKALFEITGGRSLRTNIELVRSNASLSAKIAVEYFKLAYGC